VIIEYLEVVIECLEVVLIECLEVIIECFEVVKMFLLSLQVSVFHSICQHFTPCLNYFFIERFSDPIEWFRHRGSYINR